MISRLRRWWHQTATSRGWAEIYGHLEKQVGENVTQENNSNNADDHPNGDSDTTDSVGIAVSPAARTRPAANPNSQEDIDENCTTIQHKNLYIKISGKLSLENNVKSAVGIHEVSS